MTITSTNINGFWTNHSTDTCLSYLNVKILTGFDRGEITGMILIDLQKAFDTTNHKILLDKLVLWGFFKFSYFMVQIIPVKQLFRCQY